MDKKKSKLSSGREYTVKEEKILPLKECIGQGSIERIDNLFVKDFFSIKNMELTNLTDKQEIYIVGENGDGKTLLLQAIVISLFGVREGDVFNLVKNLNKPYSCSRSKNKTPIGSNVNINLLAYGASRNNDCPLEKERVGYLTLFKNRYYLNRPEEWLIDIYNAEKSDEKTILSVLEAKELLSRLLEKNIEIDITYNKVIFKEKGSEVSFEQLSAGYKSVITIVCDLIIRFSEKQQVSKIADFQGVVLIDEIELHLHPKWQYGFMNKLRETFPLIQFIVTTHSPTVLLGAGMEAVYYQIYKDEGVVKVSEQKDVKNDFLNDIQSDIFGFDVNDERINNPSEDDKKRQKRAKENLLNLIDTIEKEQ